MATTLVSTAIVLALWFQTPVRLYPVDDTARDPGFQSFVNKLRSAVDKRDAAALRKLTDKDVVVGPEDDDKGWTKFVERWHPAERDGAAWSALSDLLTLGFVQEHPQLYLSPYLVWRYPQQARIPAPVVVIRDKAALREEPSARAAVIAYLAFDIVQRLSALSDTEQMAQWVRVRTPDGRTGFVDARDVMSPQMPRGQFGKRDGRWIMLALEGPDK